MQLANTPPLQSTAPGLHPVSIHQTSPLVRGSKHPITAYYSIYRPRKDERLSRPAWLVTYRNKVPPPGVEPGHITHPSTNRARRRVTSLIRPTLLPLRHAALSFTSFFHFSLFGAVPFSECSNAQSTRNKPLYPNVAGSIDNSSITTKLILTVISETVGQGNGVACTDFTSWMRSTTEYRVNVNKM